MDFSQSEESPIASIQSAEAKNILNHSFSNNFNAEYSNLPDNRSNISNSSFNEDLLLNSESIDHKLPKDTKDSSDINLSTRITKK